MIDNTYSQIYKVYLSNKKEPLILEQEEGEKLAMALISGKTSKFLLIDDNIINPSFLIGIFREDEITQSTNPAGYPYEKRIENPLTSSEKETHQQYLEMKKTLSQPFSQLKQLKN